MATGIITAICSALALAFGLYKWVKRMKRHKRKMAEEAKKKIEKATGKDGNESDLLDGFSKLD